MSGYIDVLKSYDNLRQQQLEDLDEGSSADLATLKGREMLRQSIKMPPDPYLIEVPMTSTTARPSLLHMSAIITCRHVQDLVSEHVRNCHDGCTCHQLTIGQTDIGSITTSAPWRETSDEHVYDRDRTYARSGYTTTFSQGSTTHKQQEHWDDEDDWQISAPNRQGSGSRPTHRSYGRPDVSMLFDH